MKHKSQHRDLPAYIPIVFVLVFGTFVSCAIGAGRLDEARGLGPHATPSQRVVDAAQARREAIADEVRASCRGRPLVVKACREAVEAAHALR